MSQADNGEHSKPALLKSHTVGGVRIEFLPVDDTARLRDELLPAYLPQPGMKISRLLAAYMEQPMRMDRSFSCGP